MLAGLAFLAGCATTGSSVAKLPDLAWPDAVPGAGQPRTTPKPQPVGPARPSADGVLPRSAWARGTPDTAAMNPMLPVEYITIHHDGMTPFTATDYASSAARVELYRNGHRGRGWGDIGYHFVVDREGRIWEGRSLKWQGAHVRNRNEGNLGILVMGNFDEQAPSERQLAARARMHVQVQGPGRARADAPRMGRREDRVPGQEPAVEDGHDARTVAAGLSDRIACPPSRSS
jgi:hypothetical protein